MGAVICVIITLLFAFCIFLLVINGISVLVAEVKYKGWFALAFVLLLLSIPKVKNLANYAYENIDIPKKDSIYLEFFL